MTYRMDHYYFMHNLWSQSFIVLALSVYVYPPTPFIISLYMVTVYCGIKSTVDPSNTNTLEFPAWSQEGDVGDAAFICFVSALFDLHVYYWEGV